MPGIHNKNGTNTDIHVTKSTQSASQIRKEKLDASLKEFFKSSSPEAFQGSSQSFCYYPRDVDFVNKDASEEIILLLRHHPITNIRWVLFAVILVLLPAFLTVLPVFESLPFGFQIIATILWYLMTTAFVLEKFLSWFFHVNIITDERIIEVDFLNLIYREITDANIDKVEDVTVTIGGGLRTIFNYGDVVVQTSAEIPQITFEAVPRPDMVAKVLRELRVEEQQETIEGRVR